MRRKVGTSNLIRLATTTPMLSRGFRYLYAVSGLFRMREKVSGAQNHLPSADDSWANLPSAMPDSVSRLINCC